MTMMNPVKDMTKKSTITPENFVINSHGKSQYLSHTYTYTYPF